LRHGKPSNAFPSDRGKDEKKRAVCFIDRNPRDEFTARQMLGDKPAILVSADAKLDLVKNDFGSTEGVVWMNEGKSGYTGYDIWRVGMPRPDANRKDVFFMIGSNGLALDRQGRLPGVR
jgi:hypothetical protein